MIPPWRYIIHQRFGVWLTLQTGHPGSYFIFCLYPVAVRPHQHHPFGCSAILLLSVWMCPNRNVRGSLYPERSKLCFKNTHPNVTFNGFQWWQVFTAEVQLLQHINSSHHWNPLNSSWQQLLFFVKQHTTNFLFFYSHLSGLQWVSVWYSKRWILGGVSLESHQCRITE